MCAETEKVGSIRDRIRDRRERRQKLIQERATAFALEQGLITETEAGEWRAMSFESFFEMIIANWPAILEMIMAIFAIFGGL